MHYSRSFLFPPNFSRHLNSLMGRVRGSFRCEQFGLSGVLGVRLARVLQHGCLEDEKPDGGDDDGMDTQGKRVGMHWHRW